MGEPFREVPRRNLQRVHRADADDGILHGDDPDGFDDVSARRAGSVSGSSKDLPYTIIDDGRGSVVVYLSASLGHPHYYAELIHKIRTAGERDEIRLVLNGPGGRCDTGVQIVNALLETPATTIAVIDGDCHSSFSLIALACKGWSVGPFANMLIHIWSGGYAGKAQEISAWQRFYTPYMEKICRGLYDNFLTEDELDRVLRGEDLWLDAEEIGGRLYQLTSPSDEEEVEAPKKATRKPARKAPVKKKK